MREFGVCGCSFHRISARPHRFLDLLFRRVERIVSHIHRPVLNLGLADSGQRSHGIGHFLFVSGDANSLDLDPSDHYFIQRRACLILFLLHRFIIESALNLQIQVSEIKEVGGNDEARMVRAGLALDDE